MLMLRISFSKVYVNKAFVNRFIEVISVLYCTYLISFFLIPLELMSVEKF